MTSGADWVRRALGAVLVAALVSLSVAGTAGAAAITPTADAYVDSGSPTTNRGTATTLKVDSSPERVSYLRFDVQGMQPGDRAVLRLYSASSHRIGYRLHSVSDTGWTELGITYATRPSIGAPFAVSGRTTSGVWYEFDVSDYVTGDGPVAFALTTTSTTAASISSREGAHPPELLVPAPGLPTDFTVSREGATSVYTAVGSDGQTLTGSLKTVVEGATSALVQAGGGTVYFTAGDFDLGSDYFKLSPDWVTYAGAGIGQTIIHNNSSAATDTEPFNFSGARHVGIRDMTVDAGGPARSTSDVLDFDAGNDSLVENVAITGSRARGIVFDGKDMVDGVPRTASNNVVRNCQISGLPTDGIELLAADHTRIEGCSISDVGGHGIQITKGSSAADQANKSSVDNSLIGNTIVNSGQDGVNVTSSQRNLIDGNVILNSADDTASRDGIRLGASDSIACDDNIISGNTATDDQAVKTQRYGLNISSALCNRTIVSSTNVFTGNLTGAIKNSGTGTIFQ